MSALVWIAAATAAACFVASVAWHHGRIVGERDEARRMLRYVNDDDVREAVRQAVAAGPRHGTQPDPWPGKP